MNKEAERWNSRSETRCNITVSKTAILQTEISVARTSLNRVEKDAFNQLQSRRDNAGNHLRANNGGGGEKIRPCQLIFAGVPLMAPAGLPPPSAYSWAEASYEVSPRERSTRIIHLCREGFIARWSPVFLSSACMTRCLAKPSRTL